MHLFDHSFLWVFLCTKAVVPHTRLNWGLQTVWDLGRMNIIHISKGCWNILCNKQYRPKRLCSVLYMPKSTCSFSKPPAEYRVGQHAIGPAICSSALWSELLGFFSSLVPFGMQSGVSSPRSTCIEGFLLIGQLRDNIITHIYLMFLVMSRNWLAAAKDYLRFEMDVRVLWNGFWGMWRYHHLSRGCWNSPGRRASGLVSALYIHDLLRHSFSSFSNIKTCIIVVLNMS
jgi:hypothetical protein